MVLFGNVNEKGIEEWIKYHKALGIDEMLFWYEPEIKRHKKLMKLFNETDNVRALEW